MEVSKETITTLASELIGEESIPVIGYLLGKKDISEFVVATKIKYEIHLVRNILYRLNNQNLATYIRKKDKIKGWYISYWTLNPKRFNELFRKGHKERVEKLKEKLEREQEYREGLYICPALCTRMNFDNAMEVNFKCSECGRLLNLQDNSRTIERLKTMIQELEASAA